MKQKNPRLSVKQPISTKYFVEVTHQGEGVVVDYKYVDTYREALKFTGRRVRIFKLSYTLVKDTK